MSLLTHQLVCQLHLGFRGSQSRTQTPRIKQGQLGLSLITGSEPGLPRKPRLVDLIEFFKETAQESTAESLTIICLDFKKAFDRVAHKRLIFQVSKCVMVRGLLEQVRDLSPSPRQRG